jgi:glycosyltransferase involved in cell wall biosynthesis
VNLPILPRSEPEALEPAPLRALARAHRLLREGHPGESASLLRELLESRTLPEGPLRTDLRLALARQATAASEAAARAAPSAVAAEDSAFAFAARSHAAYLRQHRVQLPERPPKVSVVMTCFKAEDTIRESVESLLLQSYPNLEVIVCDDHSPDGSWSILTDLARRCSGLRILRNNGNFGTYLSKNRAIDVATGDFVMFQDSDDVSHPERVSVQIAPLLEQPALMATRTKYLRYDEASGRIVPVAGLASKFGLITLAVRRAAFGEIGFFDAVRRAGDDEWVQRLVHLYGEAALRNQDVTLYLARLREGSLVADMLKFSADGKQVDQSSSPARRAYVQQFRARFAAEAGRETYRRRFPPLPLRPQDKYPDTISVLPLSQPAVHASLCSIPSRIEILRATLRSLEHQVDTIHLYLDKYESVPEDIAGHPKIHVRRSQDEVADHRDNGKFLPFDALKREGAPFFYFCCDDDIVYPHDYVHTMIRALDGFGRRVVAGVHGVVVEERPRAYFRRRFNYHFALDGLDTPRSVSNLGTGTVAFHDSLFPGIDPSAWPRGGMVNIFFSVLCRQRKVPMVCIPRHAGWMTESDPEQGTPTLFSEFREKEALIVDELRRCAPWGFQGMLESIAAQPPDIRVRLEATLPPFARALSVSTAFPRLR